ncbi:TlpA family protein disulfide reductase [Kaistella carnis]|uniref:TlpA family protein disulfide reductase n=1 Tax=Kaistella carnis TaxID=1241979 RepID=UPI0028AC5B31|nr:TlpA disulfide reductase family protein [Kaistella carnis]
MKKKFCREILSLTLLALLFLQLPAQQKALKIGDSIPEEIWTAPLPMVNSPEKITTLAKDRDKLILLDFWATWCGSCLKNFPKMDSLEKQFEGKLKVLPVTGEDLATLNKFFASKNGQRFKNLISVTRDPFLSKIFPHYAIPFIVWIKDGKVLNTTDASQVTADNIQEILQGKKSSVETVLQIGRDRPLMLAEQFDLEKKTTLVNYALLSKGRIKAIAPGSGFHRNNDGVVYGRQWTNISLMNIYRGIAYELFEKENTPFSEKRLVNLVKNPEAIDFTITHEDDPVDDRLYNFEFIVPQNKADQLYPNMLKALNEFSGYSALIEKQRTKCLVMKKTGASDDLKTKGGTVVSNLVKTTVILRNAPLEHLIVYLNVNNQFTDLNVIDETGYTDNVDLNLGTVKDLAELKKALQKYGLTLIEEERDLSMLVVRDRP